MVLGTLATLAALTNPDRRPSALRERLGRGIGEHVLVEWFELDKEFFLINLRTARRGAAAGPSGMTSDHLFPLLESERDSVMFAEFAQSLAVVDVPYQVLRILGLGRLIALMKPDGGIRGIVVGDVLRRLVGRTKAKQVTKEVEGRHFPFPMLPVNKDRGASAWHTCCKPSPSWTRMRQSCQWIGIGACDLISRGGEQLLPFVRSFCGAPSTYMWEDEMGTNHRMLQGEGGEQGDPLMPLLFSSGQHRVLTAIQDLLMEGNVCLPSLTTSMSFANLRGSRTCTNILERCLFHHARIHVPWENQNVEQERKDTHWGGRVDSTVGNQSLDTKVQGFKVLGAPIGHLEKSREYKVLFDRTPAMEDLQSAWVGAPVLSGMVRPEMVAHSFAETHDANVGVSGMIDRSRTVCPLPSHSLFAVLPRKVGGRTLELD